jgi:hypothetical protein
MQRKGGNIGWKLVSFDGSVVNQFNWPTTVREAANTPCSCAAILANDVIVIGCAENHTVHFIDARKKKELCTLHIPLEATKFPIVQPSPEFYCVSAQLIRGFKRNFSLNRRYRSALVGSSFVTSRALN